MPIYDKIQKIREDALKLDWTTDKTFPKGGRMIPFVSGEKIKRQFAPLFAKHKVDFGVDVLGYEIHPELSAKQYSQTISLTVQFVLTDTEDATQDVCRVIGFAPADDLHGPKTAISFAYNTYMTTKFQICDKLEDAIDDAESNVMDALSKMSVPEVRTPPKTEDVPKKVSQPKSKAETPKTEVSEKKELTMAEKRAVDNSLEQATKWLEDGQIVESKYNEIREVYDSVTDSQGVFQLMKLIRTVKEDIGKGKEGGF